MSALPIKANWPGQVEPAQAIYLHVPFCKAKCRYCDFYSVPFDQQQAGKFIRAATRQLAWQSKWLSRPAASIYIGGGTPTILGTKLLAELLGQLSSFAGKHTEFTIEANPATIDESVAHALAAGGVNRVSLGAQSFQAELLMLLDRLHRPGDIRRSVALLREAGIGNISLDLIYGIPGQDLSTWRDSLDRALELDIQHLSCYALSFEAGTGLAEDLAAGRVQPMDEDTQRDCYYAAIDTAERAGLAHYEISNFARPGRRCRHNLTYWHNESYIGIGPAAASYVACVRSKNLSNLDRYVSAVLNGRRAPATRELLSFRTAMAETLMLLLRLTDGLDRSCFAGRFGVDALQAFGQSLTRQADLGAVLITDSNIRVSPESLFWSDSVLADILAEA